MRIEDRLVTKISSYTPKQTIHDPTGKAIAVIPEGEVQMYLTFEDEETPVRVRHIEVESVQGLTLISYTPVDTGNSMYASRDGIVAVVSENVKYEELD